MATIHKLTKDGATIFPATITDAVVHPQTGKTLTSMIKDYNVSELFPTEGIDGGNKYNLALAIQVLGTHLSAAQKTGGIKLTFISSVSPYPEEEYYLGKSSWSATASDWDQRFEVGDVVADPSGSWTPGTAEQYIDQQVATVTGNLASETLARQTADQSLQNQINAEATTRANVDNTKADKATTLAGYGITNAYTKTEVNDLVDTPHQNYVTVQTYSALPATGSADTIYRVSSYDGSVPEVNVTKYSEYAWSTSLSQYIFLCVKSQIDEVFDITVYHSNTTYSDLASALGTDGVNIPPTLRRGGMSVKYVQTSDNKYVQYRLMSDTFNTTPANWQGVDDKPTDNSDNLIKSGGVAKQFAIVKSNIGIDINGVADFSSGTIKYVEFYAKVGDSIELSLENIGSNTDNTGVRVFYSDGTDAVIYYFAQIPVGDSASYTFIAAKDIIKIGLTLNSARTKYNVVIKNLSGLNYEVVNIEKDINNISSKVGFKVTGVADFSSKAAEAFLFYIEKDSKVNIILENIGTNADATRITALYSDGTSQNLYYLPVPVGETKNYEFVAEKDIVAIELGLNAARTKFNVTIQNLSSVFGDIDSINKEIDDIESNQAELGGINLFDKYLTNSCITALGEIITAEGYWVTDKVYFNGHSKITCNHCDVNWKYAIYKEDDSVLSVGAQNVNTTVQNVENGAYVRFTLYSMSARRFPINIWYCDNGEDYSGKVLYPNVRKEVVITANSNANSGADFVGQSAIQDAINSITDFSGKTKYIIRCTGNFVAEKPSDYIYYNVFNNWAMFWMYPYITLDGINPDNCIIRATLPDTVPSGYTPVIYSSYQPLYVKSDTCEGIKNITFVTRNCRYPLHIDSGGDNYENTVKIENCRLIHEGKHGDSIGTAGGTACGFGIAGEEQWIFKDCQFEAPDNALYVHDNTGYNGLARVDFDNCQFHTLNRSFRNGITINNLGNLAGVLVNVKKCRFNKYTGISYTINTINPAIERVDGYARMRLVMDNDPMPFVIDVGRSLQFTSVVEANSSIRVDEESSAFDAIFGYSDEPAYIDYNKFGYHQQYGYEWRDGDTGLAAVAMGFRLIDDSIHSLGARLGDCSGTNKTLTLTVNGTNVNVVFNANYTSYTNAQVLEVINTQLTGVAVASIYRTADDYYPEFNNEGLELVDDDTPILVGHGLKFTESGVRKATSADGGIDAIAVDAGIDGQHIRVIYDGMFSISSYSTKILKLASDTSRDSCVFGAKLGISASQAGCFSLLAEDKVVVCGLSYSVEFIK